MDTTPHIAGRSPRGSRREHAMFTGLIVIAVLAFSALYIGRRLRRRP